MTTQRSLDHFVTYVQELGIASNAWRRLGFTVMPIMEHISIGTANAIVQFEGTYLELLGDAEHCVIASLKQNLRRNFPSYDGYYMTSFTSSRLEDDRAPLEREGIELQPIVGARRRVRLPAGGWIDTASRSMYAFHNERPRMSLFLSDHPKPEAIWIPDYQSHANSVVDVLELHYVARQPEQDAAFIGRMMGGAPAQTSRDGMLFRTPRGQKLAVHSEEAARARWPEFSALQGNDAAHGLGLTLQVCSLAQCRRALREGGVPHRVTESALVVPPSHASGVIIEFTESTEAK
ncbi:MAG: VOC family protein [Nevskiaceae bacterium]